MNDVSLKASGKRNRILRATGVFALMLGITAGTAHAQVPQDIEVQLQKIGHIVDPSCTAKLYRPLMPANDIASSVTPLYPGIAIARDVSFGPNPKDVVDIFTADKGPASRPVLMYIPGGAGNKIELQSKEDNAFYDNIMRWATQNGMVGVNMQRHGGHSYDDGAKDISSMIQWVEANISKYHGNPDRMFIWAQSAGNGPLGIYIGHPELYGPKGVGVKGVIFMSGQFDILPAQPAGMGGAPRPGQPAPNLFGNAGKLCGGSVPNATDGALPGKKPGEAGGPAEATTGGGGGPGGQQADAATQLARSSLPALQQTKVAIFLASAELDPGVDGAMSPFNQTLHDELCKIGPDHCPAMLFEKGESHMSEVFSIDTPDKTVSGPILAWMKKVK